MVVPAKDFAIEETREKTSVRRELWLMGILDIRIDRLEEVWRPELGASDHLERSSTLDYSKSELIGKLVFQSLSKEARCWFLTKSPMRLGNRY